MGEMIYLMASTTNVDFHSHFLVQDLLEKPVFS